MPVCVQKGAGCRSQRQLETEGWEIQKAEQGATQWGTYETREQRQGSLRQIDEEDRDQERPETTGTGKDGEGAGRWLRG